MKIKQILLVLRQLLLAGCVGFGFAAFAARVPDYVSAQPALAPREEAISAPAEPSGFVTVNCVSPEVVLLATGRALAINCTNTPNSIVSFRTKTANDPAATSRLLNIALAARMLKKNLAITYETNEAHGFNADCAYCNLTNMRVIIDVFLVN